MPKSQVARMAKQMIMICMPNYQMAIKNKKRKEKVRPAFTGTGKVIFFFIHCCKPEKSLA